MDSNDEMTAEPGERFCLVNEPDRFHRYFWTGSYWSGVKRFAKQYTVTEALSLLARRFSKMSPKPLVLPWRRIEKES